jgi:hypothetical protein
MSRMEPDNKQTSPSASSMATSILVRNLAEQGVLTDPAITRFLEASNAIMPTPATISQVPPPATTNATAPRTEAEILKLKTLKHLEIAVYMLSNRELSTKEIADQFGVTPATIARILSTDGFQLILSDEAKKMSTAYKGLRAGLESSMHSAALLAMDRLLDRIQVCNDTEQLLAIASKLAELVGMGNKAQQGVTINQYGMTGNDLRFATQGRPSITLDQAPNEPLAISG